MYVNSEKIVVRQVQLIFPSKLYWRQSFLNWNRRYF
jgi:hypothetical protein